MRTIVEITEPPVILRRGNYKTATELALVFSQTMEGASEISGVDQVRLRVNPDGGSDLFTEKYGIPLRIICQALDDDGAPIMWVRGVFFVNEETNQAMAWVDDDKEDRFIDEIDAVVELLSAKILKQLESQATPA